MYTVHWSVEIVMFICILIKTLSSYLWSCTIEIYQLKGCVANLEETLLCFRGKPTNHKNNFYQFASEINFIVHTPCCKWTISRGDDSSLPVCSVSCTVHLQLFTNIDILQVRPESPFNKQICSTPLLLVKDWRTSSLYTL